MMGINKTNLSLGGFSFHTLCGKFQPYPKRGVVGISIDRCIGIILPKHCNCVSVMCFCLQEPARVAHLMCDRMICEGAQIMQASYSSSTIFLAVWG